MMDLANKFFFTFHNFPNPTGIVTSKFLEHCYRATEEELLK